MNSTAMLLLLLDEGWEFESVYVDHGCDWPETRDYVQMMVEKYPITILKPQVRRHKHGKVYESLYDYCLDARITPSMKFRWCTKEFKVLVIEDYTTKPCFQLIGIDAGESHRAKFSCVNGVENRFPLIEYDIDRKGCIEIIKKHGLPVPMKSGCYFCPFQRGDQVRLLRRKHPELFCRMKKIEDQVVEKMARRGKPPHYIYRQPLDVIVNERQSVMWPEMKPPCTCGL